MKICTKCKQPFPLTHFYKDKKSPDGLCSQCKTCRNAYHKINYQDNKEDRAMQKSQYYREHIEWEHERRKKRYCEHGEHERIRNAQYARTERGKMIRRVSDHRRRTRKLNASGAFTAEQFQEQIERQKHKCYYCQQRHIKKGFVWHADHVVPLSRGGTNDISNIVAACPTCNMQKQDKFPHEYSEGGRLL